MEDPLEVTEGAVPVRALRQPVGHRLLEDLSRTFAEAGINIVEARCLVQHPMTRNRFVIEVGDTQALKSAINRLRAIDSVFDAYRVIPAGG